MDYFIWIEEAAELLSQREGFFYQMETHKIIEILQDRIEGLPLIYAVHKPDVQDLVIFAHENPLITRHGLDNVSFIVDFKKRKGYI